MTVSCRRAVEFGLCWKEQQDIRQRQVLQSRTRVRKRAQHSQGRRRTASIPEEAFKVREAMYSFDQAA